MNFLNDIFWRVILRCAVVGPRGDRLRGVCWQKLGVIAGKNFKVGSGVIIHSPKKLTVGDNVYIGVMSYIGAGTIRMGNEVLIGNHVQVTASNHSPDKTGNYRFGRSVDKGVLINDGAWLCGGCRILAGASVGAKSLIGPNVIVRGSVPPKTRLIDISQIEGSQ